MPVDSSEPQLQASSVSSEAIQDYQSTNNLHISGSSDNTTDEVKLTDDDDTNEVTLVDDFNEPALFQPSGNLEINKVYTLADIPEEEEEESGSTTRSLQASQKSLQLGKHDVSLNTTSSLSSSNSDMKKETVTERFRHDILMKDFDELLKELKTSEHDRSLSLSSDDPTLPLSVSLMPNLRESTPIGNHDTDQVATDFVKAMNRLSQTSLDSYYEPGLPPSSPPGKLLSPRHSFLNIGARPHTAHAKKESEEFAELLAEQLNKSQLQENGAMFSRQNSSESQKHHLLRQPSFSQSLLPPKEFSEDSGLPASDTDEGKRRTDAVAHKTSQLSLKASRNRIIVSTF